MRWQDAESEGVPLIIQMFAIGEYERKVTLLNILLGVGESLKLSLPRAFYLGIFWRERKALTVNEADLTGKAWNRVELSNQF